MINYDRPLDLFIFMKYEKQVTYNYLVSYS